MTPKMGCKLNSSDVISLDTNAPNSSLILSVNGPSQNTNAKNRFKTHFLHQVQRYHRHNVKFDGNVFAKRYVNGPEERTKK